MCWQFIPTEMDVSARHFIALPTVGVVGATPVTSSNPLVEVGIITASGLGTAMPLINWSGGPRASFSVTLHFALQYKEVTLASGGKVTASADKKTFTFALAETVDALIFR